MRTRSFHIKNIVSTFPFSLEQDPSNTASMDNIEDDITKKTCTPIFRSWLQYHDTHTAQKTFVSLSKRRNSRNPREGGSSRYYFAANNALARLFGVGSEILSRGAPSNLETRSLASLDVWRELHSLVNASRNSRRYRHGRERVWGI